MIESYVAKKDIKYLVHFTREDNLENILKHGIIPRATIEQNGMQFEYNDAYRIDGHEDATCCSIMFPNYRMFYKYRLEDTSIDWVVLVIDPSILWQYNVAFCIENAAAGGVTCLPIGNRQGIKSLKKMFDEWPGHETRREMGLKDCMPTNPQAEILVFNIIPPAKIKGVICSSRIARKKLKRKFENIDIRFISRFFKWRIDFKFWQG